MIGVVQFQATKDRESNFKKSSNYIKKAAERGATLVCLPEHFAYHELQVSSSISHHKTYT